MPKTAVNINTAGEITQQAGVPAEITVEKIDVGHYKLYGSLGIAKNGWRASVFKDENGNNTIVVDLDYQDSTLTIKTFDPINHEPKDIENLLTLRLEVDPPPKQEEELIEESENIDEY
jgi:hypothetical protein